MGKKIKWGVLGTAGIAAGCTIPGMKKAEDCELYAIAGRSIKKAEAFKERFGFGTPEIYRWRPGFLQLRHDPGHRYKRQI